MSREDDDSSGQDRDPGPAQNKRRTRPHDLAHDDAARVYAETLGLEVSLADGDPEDLDVAEHANPPVDPIDVELEAPGEHESAAGLDASGRPNTDSSPAADDDREPEEDEVESNDGDAEALEPEADADEPDSGDDFEDDEHTLRDGEAPRGPTHRLPLRGLTFIGVAGGLWTTVAVMRCDESEAPVPPMAVSEPDETKADAPVKAVEIETPPTPVAEVAPPPEEDAPLPESSDPRPEPASWVGDAREPREVGYTVRHGGSIKNVANLFKIFHHEIQGLNPGVPLDKNLPPNTRVVVYRQPKSGESHSVGLPSQGSLELGVPMLEGPGRHLKAIPWKAWGTAHTVGLLDQVLRQWAKAGHKQAVLVGNMSARTGGRLQPHSTHQSGRDVDLGYLQKLPPGEELNWREMSARNLDGDETWALLKLLVQTGQVEVIYVDRAIQKLLYDHAVANGVVDKRALRKWMEYPKSGGRPLLQHVKGHVDHMHVRFKCQPAETRCKSRG